MSNDERLDCITIPASTISRLVEEAVKTKDNRVEKEIRLYAESKGYSASDPLLRVSLNVAYGTATTDPDIIETYTAMLPNGSTKRILRVEQAQASVDIIPLWRMEGEK